MTTVHFEFAINQEVVIRTTRERCTVISLRLDPDGIRRALVRWVERREVYTLWCSEDELEARYPNETKGGET